ncbi:MAG: hypothetical protein PF961_03760 [Planctomycetota bacterium]|jgi:hypothetical protein|nr:hypothetical protein [Planctomycetota bacterium]
MTPAHSRTGVAIITALVLILTLTAMAATITSLTVTGLQQQEYRKDTVSILMSAESGLNMGIAHLQQNYGSLVGPGGDLDVTDTSKTQITVPLSNYADASLDPGTMINGTMIDVTVQYQFRDTVDTSSFLISSTATVGEASDPANYRRTRVEATVMPIPQEVFDNAMLALEGYDFTGSAGADSWNSNDTTTWPNGYVAGGASGGFGDLASEGDISEGNGTFFDHVYDNRELPLPFFDYESQKAGAGSLTPIGDGAGLVSNTYVGSMPSNTLTLSAGSYSCTAIDLGNQHYIEVTGAVEIYVDKHIVFAPKSGDVVIKYTGGTLKLYQGDYTGTESSFDNNGGILGDATPVGGNNWSSVKANPQNLIVFTEYKGTMQMNGNGLTAAVFFAPEATIKFNGTFDFFGSVIAKRFDSKVGNSDDPGKVNGSFTFHYDENLKDLDLGLTARLLIQGWRSFNLGVGHRD